MGDLLIRNVPDELTQDLAARAERNGTSVSDEAKGLLRQVIAASDARPVTDGMSAYEAIRSAFEKEGPLDDEFAAIMDEIEAERKKDFGRPLDDFE